MSDKKVANKKTENELTNKSLKDLKVDLKQIRLDIVSGNSSDTSQIKKYKKEIARKLTQLKKVNNG